MLLSFVSAFFFVIPPHPDFLHPAPFYFPFAIIAFLALGVLYVISIPATLKHVSEKWQRPSWFLTPFNPKQPLVFFDFGAFGLMFYGLGCAVIGLSSAPTNWAWEIPVSGGCGVWLGVRLGMLVHRNRLEGS